MAKGTTRVNGKNGESMWVTDDEICFRTGGKVQKIALGNLSSLAVENNEDARKLVVDTELVPYGAWTEDMPSTKGKSAFLVATSDDRCWVMEMNKSQLPTAQEFVRNVAPEGEDALKRQKVVAGRAIDTPLGGLFTILSILCVFAAILLVFTLNQPLIGLIVAIAGLVMYFLIK